jgi:hypothetical protein
VITGINKHVLEVVFLATIFALAGACGKSKKSGGSSGETTASTNPLPKEALPTPTVSSIESESEDSATEGDGVLSADDAVAIGLTSSMNVARFVSILPPPSAVSAAQHEYVSDEGNFLTGIRVRGSHDTAMSRANYLLCIAAQLSYPVMENEDAYVAYADLGACRNPDSENLSRAGESFALPVSMAAVKVVVRRQDPKDPLQVNFWLDDRHVQDPALSTRWDVSMRIVAGTSKSHPWGVFRLSWRGYDLDASISPSVAAEEASKFGSLSIAEVQEHNFSWELLDWDEDSGEKKQGIGRITLDSESGAVSSGKMRLLIAENSLDAGQDVLFTFDETHIAWTDPADSAVISACLDRTAYEFGAKGLHLWNVTTGKPFVETPGTPILMSLGSDAYSYGWLTQGALRLLAPAVAADGDRVKFDSWGDNGSYERRSAGLKVAAGRLIRHTAKSLVFTKLKNVNLEVLDRNATEATIVTFDGEKFVKLGVRSPAAGDATEFARLETPEEFPLAQGMHLFWARQLAGYVAIDVAATLTDSVVTYYDQEDVTASSAELTLSCSEFCPRPNITQEQADGTSGASPFFAPPVSDTDLSQMVVYTFDPEDLALKKNGDSVVLHPSVTAIAGYHGWGIRSGPLFSSDSVLASIHDGWKLPSFYTWEVGAELSNRTTFLVDDDLAPLSHYDGKALDYQHAVANVFSGSAAGTADEPMILQDIGAGSVFGAPVTFSDENAFGWVSAVALASQTWASTEGHEIKMWPDLVEVEMAAASAKSECSTVAGSHGDAEELPALTAWKGSDLLVQPAGYPPVRVIGGRVTHSR